MSSSAHSALASLTANYTDSEPEEEDVEQEETDKADEPATSSISPAGADESNSRDAQSVSSGGADSNSGGSRKKSNRLGLVSYYHDDNIDADDDMDNGDPMDSDSAQGGKDVITSGTDEDSVIIHSNNAEGGAADLNATKNDKHGIVDLEDISQDKDMTSQESESQSKPKKSKLSIPLPPEPSGKCSDELQRKFTRLYERRKMQPGFNLNAVIQRNKQFRNPSIYEKLIIQCDIKELGTNYPNHIYDPFIWDESSHYDELAKAQKTEMDRREKERKERTKVEFVSGTVKKTTSSGGGQSEEPKRKSKWDQKGVMPIFGAASVAAPAIQPVLVQPPFTTNNSGTKGTVINAFGSLPKKPKM